MHGYRTISRSMGPLEPQVYKKLMLLPTAVTSCKQTSVGFHEVILHLCRDFDWLAFVPVLYKESQPLWFHVCSSPGMLGKYYFSDYPINRVWRVGWDNMSCSPSHKKVEAIVTLDLRSVESGWVIWEETILNTNNKKAGYCKTTRWNG